MPKTKTLREREEELQKLMASDGGRGELRYLEGRCTDEGGRPRPAGTSIITYIIVHERGRGLIVG